MATCAEQCHAGVNEGNMDSPRPLVSHLWSAAAVVKSQVCGENTFSCWAQAESPPALVPLPAHEAREATQQSETTWLGPTPPGWRLQGNSNPLEPPAGF